MPEAPRRRRPGSPRRKDRLIQTRVARDLESTLKREAQRRRLTVSHLIRNILEDTFQLVDDVVGGVDEIVNDSVELARRVGRDARRMAGAVRDAVTDPADGPDAAAPPAEPGDDPLAHVFAWNAVIAHRDAVCSRCQATIARGDEALVGLSDDARRPRTWLCGACREAL